MMRAAMRLARVALLRCGAVRVLVSHGFNRPSLIALMTIFTYRASNSLRAPPTHVRSVNISVY